MLHRRLFRNQCFNQHYGILVATLIHLAEGQAGSLVTHPVHNFGNKQFKRFNISNFGSSHPEVFFEKGVLKTCIKFAGEHPCRSVISIKLQSSFIEITLRHGCSPVNLLHIFRTPFSRNTSGWLFSST